MSEQLRILLEDLKEWINAPIDDLEYYGIWELEANESKELLNYINQLQQENKQLKEQLQSKKQELNGFVTTIAKYLEFEELEFATYDEIIERIVEMKNYKKKLKQRDEVNDEILKCAWFSSDCPYSLIGDGWIQELCDCDNCEDDYKHCWLKYFKSKYKGDNNE